MGDSLEPGAQLLTDEALDFYRRVVAASGAVSASKVAQPLLDHIDALSSLSRPLPDPELREKIAPTEIEIFDALKEAFTKRNSVLDGHTTLCDCSYCLARTATNAVLGVLGVDGSAETGKQ